MPSLKEYDRKRRPGRTPEPGARKAASASGHLYVIQKHRATQLHYDFRLEHGGVLLSWAVPKGPSLDPAVKRLAMAVEDHPLEYASFEGVIPEGEYGGGTVMVWDTGTYVPEDEHAFSDALRRGELKFTLRGKKLKGAWVLVRTGGRMWLLMKKRDRHASKTDIAVAAPRSVVSRRLLAGIAAAGGGDVKKAATADPSRRTKRLTSG